MFGILFIGGVPKIAAMVGAPALFWSFVGIMAFAAFVAAFGFPESGAAGTVLVCGPIVQALLTLLITQSQSFIPYAAGAMFVAAVMILTHTFMKSG